MQYVLVTEVALAVVAPFLLLEADARRDFARLALSRRGALRLLGLTAIGLAGLALYNLGLRRAHPVVISAILNLSPFWAALVARGVSGVRIPAGAAVFATALAGAFAGAMLVAYSQMRTDDVSGEGLAHMFGRGSWWFAIPVPVFTSLSGTLIACGSGTIAKQPRSPPRCSRRRSS